MNKFTLDINALPKKNLPILTDDEAGERFCKWSFVNIYSLTALRDIYIITKDVENKTVRFITAKANEVKIKKDSEKVLQPFTERQVLENLNALVKFGLLNCDYSIKKRCFEDSPINSDLSESDKKTLEDVFFNYFRFRELSSWFIDTSPNFHNKFEELHKQDFVEKSNPLYFYSDKCRFNNSFLRNVQAPIIKYFIENDILMRFWDVYIKWGTTLNIIDKLNLSRICEPINKKEISMTYFIKEFKPFDLKEFISSNFDVRNIWIPELIFMIARKYRFSVNDIKKFIIYQIEHNDEITFERTSEIFLIKGKTSSKNIKDATYLYPLVDDFYISNLIVRK